MLTDGDISTDGGTGGGTIIGKDKDIDCITPTDEERGGSTIAAQLQMILKTLSLVE